MIANNPATAGARPAQVLTDMQSGNERAEYFANRRGAALFSVLNLPAREARRTGVVLCHPMGEEKHKSYRAYVELARRLAASGFASLRFDCEGFGDSEGELVQATVCSQLDDIRDAVARLQDVSAVTRVALIGARFGATLAALAGSDARVAALALIAPIVSGASYWESMLRAHQMSFMMRGLKTKKRQDLLDELSSDGYIEISADFLSKSLVDQITAIDLLSAPHQFEGPCFIAAVASDNAGVEDARALANALLRGDSNPTLYLDQERDFWSTGSLYAGYLPQDLYTRIGEWLERVDS